MYKPGIGEAIFKIMNSEPFKAAKTLSQHQPPVDKASQAAMKQAAYIKAFVSKIDPALKPQQQFNKLLSRIRVLTDEEIVQGQQIAASYGWYINYSFAMNATRKAVVFVEGGHIDALNEYMIEEIDGDYEDFKQGILARFPHRAPPLIAAFRAHEQGEYFLSIPVFLAQAEGISEELTEYKIFANKREAGQHVPAIRDWVITRDNTNRFSMAILSSILIKGALQLHRNDQNNIDMTRHSVLHGECNTYGSKENSYRTLSLLFYIYDVCGREQA